ncbi:NAC domain-containing protein 8-like [Pyrus ussuriensis x Pyrus communis]|uniref:NAC domain-containing protein 8-like n=1 Tax=Pyrus ussuriensis x Pyrus communis TaxID=2448454 RepID=A0A5N5H9P4_9ROSA|nr:NAC domain-containing protein 8-like [Pyrus ussuriensis x Pyrus communis]
MAGPSWLFDKNRIATKIRSASGSYDSVGIKWQSNPTKSCPKCHYTIDNSDVAQEWPGLPKGVKFDPTDQEIIWHLLAKSGVGDQKPHPFIDEFILTVDDDEGICCSHPRKLPNVKLDGSPSHFFHRAIKAYNTGTRKRRKIHDGDGDVRWHKTGRTKPVILDGVQKGCKKIMVLYMSTVRGGKPVKTNWVMHQYHLGIGEDEKDGEYVISKIYYQQQEAKQADKTDQDVPESIDAVITKVDPVTPKLVTPEPPRAEQKLGDFDLGLDTPAPSRDPFLQYRVEDGAEDEDEVHFEVDRALDEIHPEVDCAEDDVCPESEMPDDYDQHKLENQADEVINNTENIAQEDPKWWDSESQNLLDSQQLVEGLSLCDDLLQSQSPTRGGLENGEQAHIKPRLADYAKLGPEDLKRDLEACQNLVLDPANILELDTPPDFRLSQLEFGSQESFLSWGGKVAD